MRKNPKSSLDKLSKICYNKHTKGIRKKVVRGLPSSSDRLCVRWHTRVGSGVFVLPKIIIPHCSGIVKPLLEIFSIFFLWDFRDICSTISADICIREFYFRAEKENVIHISQSADTYITIKTAGQMLRRCAICITVSCRDCPSAESDLFSPRFRHGLVSQSRQDSAKRF